MEGHDGLDPVLMARREDMSVVVELSLRELALGWLDAGPFDAEPESVKPETSQEGDVLAKSVVEVTSVTRWLQAGGALPVLPFPPVAVDVAAFDLVRPRRRAD